MSMRRRRVGMRIRMKMRMGMGRKQPPSAHGGCLPSPER